MTTTETPPRWDLSPIFAGLDDRAFGGALEGIFAAVDRLGAQFDEYDIRATEPRSVTDRDVQALEAVLTETNDVQSQMRIVSTYLYALVTTDSRDDQAAANMVELLSPIARISIFIDTSCTSSATGVTPMWNCTSICGCTCD